MSLRVEAKESWDILYSLAGDLQVSARPRPHLLEILWPDGTADGQANLPWSDIGATLAAGATRNLDLRSLTLLGTSITFAEVRAVLIYSDVELSLAKGASNGWTGWGAAWALDVQGYFRHVTPTDGAWSTSGTDKVIDITNNTAGTATYDIVILGTAS